MIDSRPFVVRHADLIFAVKTFAAAMLAFVIALWLDLPRPYWAMATVYITSQPLAGATSSKALYRVLGTLTGAAASIAIIPTFVDAPELLCLVIALWVGLCLYLSLLDGTPRSYTFMLAGYTVALIGFPEVSTPGNIFDDAVARVEEISSASSAPASFPRSSFRAASGLPWPSGSTPGSPQPAGWPATCSVDMATKRPGAFNGCALRRKPSRSRRSKVISPTTG